MNRFDHLGRRPFRSVIAEPWFCRIGAGAIRRLHCHLKQNDHRWHEPITTFGGCTAKITGIGGVFVDPSDANCFIM
jgi:hypothetical protein